MRKFLLGLLTLILTPAVHALEIQLNTQGLDSIQVNAVEKLISEAQTLLPTSFKDRLNKTITLSFKNLSEHGHTLGQKIVMSSKLLPHIVLGKANAGANTTLRSHHMNYYDVALGTLLHELGHHYDSHPIENLPERQKRLECLSLQNSLSRKEQGSLPNYCTWNLYKYNVSDNPQFIYSLNWSEKELKDQKVLNDDDATNRSPNPYEFKSSHEAFAVNLEFFLMDPEFKCRRPTAYQFLSNHFRESPHREFSCTVGKNVITMMATASSLSYVFEKIDPKRVAAVHYLLAGDGPSAMSMWGHSMLRLVICAPHRPEVGPECLKDIAYHRVISYRAGVTDLAIDALKGLSGEYPSQIFVLPLLNVINEYTKLEMRELFSYPLTLNRVQIEDFVVRSQEQYWSYRGRYYFISNNCATETFRILKMVKPENTDFASEKTVTPKGVRDLIINKGYGPRLSEEDLKKNNHLYWPSKQGLFQEQINKLNQGAGTHFKNPQEFLALKPSQHEPILLTLKQNNASLAPFFILEMLKLEQLTTLKNKVLLNEEAKKQDSKMLKALKEKLKSLGNFIGTHYKGTYGIPFDQEVDMVKMELEAKQGQEQLEMQKMEAQGQAFAEQLLGSDFVKEMTLSKELLLQTTEAIKKNK